MTTFICLHRPCSFEVMLFGLKRAPLSFHRIMHSTLTRVLFSRVYISDVIILRRTLDEHEKHDIYVMKIIAQYGLKLRISKSHFAHSRIEVLEHVVDANGRSVYMKNIQAIRKATLPTTTTGIRRLEVARYYRRLPRDLLIQHMSCMQPPSVLRSLRFRIK